MKQLNINLFKGRHGGRRPKSGKRRIHSKGVAHEKRELVTRHTPLHINFKYSTFIQTEKVLSILETACYNALKFDFEVCYYSVQSNHIHLIAEARDNESLIKGMRSVTNTIVKRIGKGSIQFERYHLHVLKNPTETKNALDYVINNDLKHSGRKNKFNGNYSSGDSWLLQEAEKKLLLH